MSELSPLSLQILNEFEEKFKKPKFQLDKFLFKEQMEFVKDPARFVTAVCSVRAGKTMACAADLIDTALTMPGTISCYITLARSSAERIIWPELKKIIRDFQLDAEPNESKLSLKFSNGSIIYLMGGNDEAEIEKIRGLSNVALVYLDESQAFRAHIRDLVEDIVTKRLYDTNGRCRMIGTPGPLLSGYFYDCSLSETWAHHHWTMHVNPWLLKKSGKTPDELILQDCERRGVSIDDPSIQRECFGRWKLDPNALLLNYDRSINHYDELPRGVYTYILGIDLGVRDSDALCLLAFSETSSVTYLVEEMITPNQKTDDLAKQIQALMKDYRIKNIVADTGGLGLKVVEDMMDRYHFPIEAADKRGKYSNYKFLNNALRTGNFKAKHTSRFAQDCNILERDDDKSTPDKMVIRGHSDAIDATLYAFKLSPAYNYKPAVEPVKPGTVEYYKLQEDKHIQSAMEQAKRDKNLQSSENLLNWNKDKKGLADWNKW